MAGRQREPFQASHSLNSRRSSVFVGCFRRKDRGPKGRNQPDQWGIDRCFRTRVPEGPSRGLAGLILDASVLIAHLDSTDTQHERAVTLLLEAAEESFRASPITLAEVLTGPARMGALGRAKAALAEIGVRSTGLDNEAPEKLAEIRAATGLKMPDCCVVLAAEQEGTDLATFDDRLAAAARARGIPIRN